MRAILVGANPTEAVYMVWETEHDVGSLLDSSRSVTELTIGLEQCSIPNWLDGFPEMLQ